MSRLAYNSSSHVANFSKVAKEINSNSQEYWKDNQGELYSRLSVFSGEDLRAYIKSEGESINSLYNRNKMINKIIDIVLSK